MEVGRRGRSEIEEQNFLGIAVIVIISGLIGSIELRYGIGAVLLLGVLFQFSLERMRETFRVAAESAGSAWVGKRKRFPRKNCLHASPPSSISGEVMAERTRRPGALAVVCSFCLVVAGAVVWDVQSTESEAVGHWLSVTLVMAGLLSCTWRPARSGANLRKNGPNSNPRTDVVGLTLLDGRQVRRIPISEGASAVTPWRHLKRMRDSRAHSALRNACVPRPTSGTTRLLQPAGLPVKRTTPT